MPLGVKSGNEVGEGRATIAPKIVALGKASELTADAGDRRRLVQREGDAEIAIVADDIFARVNAGVARRLEDDPRVGGIRDGAGRETHETSGGYIADDLHQNPLSAFMKSVSLRAHARSWLV